MLIQVVGAFLGIMCVSVTYGVERKFFKFCGLCGASGWLVYLLLQRYTENTAVLVFCASSVVAFLAHILARSLKSPVTVFLIPGILPLVPGLKLYRCVYNLIMAENDLASQYFNLTLQSAGCIALAIFIMDTIFRILNQYLFPKRIKNGQVNTNQNDANG